MRTKDVFLVLIMNLAFGATFISAKVGVTEFPAFMFTALRFLIVADVAELVQKLKYEAKVI